MKQTALVDEQFGSTAAAYLTSAVHANGADLEKIKTIAQRFDAPTVLDLGCGAGHASFAMAPFASSVIAYDLSERMLSVVADAATEKHLQNIVTQYGKAESLPFAIESFDVVVTRLSAHHWEDVPAAMKEASRVLKPHGVLIVIDIISPENPLHDTTLQAIELLRDASHVRDYRISEWAAIFANANLAHALVNAWQIRIDFDSWIARMRTPLDRTIAIKSLMDSAPEETAAYFQIENDYSFSIDAAMFEAWNHSP